MLQAGADNFDEQVGMVGMVGMVPIVDGSELYGRNGTPKTMLMPGEIPSNIAMYTLPNVYSSPLELPGLYSPLVHWGSNPSYHLFLAIWVITSCLGLPNLTAFPGRQRLLLQNNSSLILDDYTSLLQKKSLR